MDYFDLIKSRPPSQPEIQDIRRRMNQQPGISDSQATADDGVSRGTAAGQRADEAHNRQTNAALDAAHITAEQAHSRASNIALNNAHVKAENAHLNADARLSRTDGGVVSGIIRADAFRAAIICLLGGIPAGGTATYTVGSKSKHLPIAYVLDGTNGYIPLPTVGSSPIFVFTNTDTQFTIKNTRTTIEQCRARLWEDPDN